METQTVLNGKALSKITNHSHTAEVVMTSLAMRERHRKFTDVNRLKANLIKGGEKIVEADYLAFWKGLQDEGAGSIIYGRKNNPTRFEWHYSLKEVSKAAIEGAGKETDKARSEPRFKRVFKTEALKPQSRIIVPLRKDYNFEISVPSDLSKSEMSTLISALQNMSL